MKNLKKLCEKFVLDNQISCPEAVFGNDKVIENAYDFIKSVCDIVGYYNYEFDVLEKIEK